MNTWKNRLLLLGSLTLGLVLMRLLLPGASPRGAAQPMPHHDSVQNDLTATRMNRYREKTDLFSAETADSAVTLTTRPPIASLITIGLADVDGMAMISGAAGAADPGTPVYVAGLDTGMITSTMSFLTYCLMFSKSVPLTRSPW